MRNILILFVALFVGCVKETTLDYNTTVRDFQPIVTKAFDEADKLMETEKDEINDGQDPDPVKCICKGTGRIVQGDGHVTDCRYHKKNSEQPTENEEIKTLKQENETYKAKIKDLEGQINALSRELVNLRSTISQIEKKASTMSKENTVQLVFLTAEWCAPCRLQKAKLQELKDEGYDVGTEPTSQIRIIDVDKNIDEYRKYRGATSSIPVNVLLVNGEVKHRIVGFIDKEKIIGYLTST